MKSIFSKKNILSICALVLVLACVAVGARANYTPPISGPTGNNAYGYIDIGGTPGGAGAGVKQGGLSVNVFTAKDNALFNDQVFFNAPIQGLPADPKTINFGDTSHVVALSINNNMKGQTLQSDTVKNKNNTAGSGLDYLCSTGDGTIILCDESSGGGGYDLCSNLPGDQTTVPAGYVRNADGTCSENTPATTKINWHYTNAVGVGGNFRISINGTTKVSQSTSGSGTFETAVGDVVSVLVQTSVSGTATVQISGIYSHSESQAHIVTDFFTTTAGTADISGISG